MPHQKNTHKDKVWMPTTVQQKLRDKTITAKKWAEMVKPGDWINRGGPGSDTLPTMEALSARLADGSLNNIEIWNQAIMLGNNFFAAADPEAKNHVLHESFLLPTLRGLVGKGYKGLDWKHWGWALGMDAEYARNYRKEKGKRAMDWGVQACAVPEAGWVNASYGVNNFMITAKSCKKFGRSYASLLSVSHIMSAKLDRYDLLNRSFEENYGGSPSVWVRARGRVDLMGSHTDYNLGYVLTLPIGWDTWMAIRPRGDQWVRLFSLNLEAGNGFDLADIQRLPGKAWSNYVRGVVSILAKGGFDLRGFDAVIHSTVPISSGLSSSAALECATATAFEGLSGNTIDPVRKALLCQRAENEFVGVNCGILDQYTSCMGRSRCALLLDCRLWGSGNYRTGANVPCRGTGN